jgi:hypothetical protein
VRIVSSQLCSRLQSLSNQVHQASALRPASTNGQRGADRTVVLSSIQLLSNLLSSSTLQVHQASAAARAQLEQDTRNAIRNMRSTLMQNMVEGEVVT